MGGGHRPGKVFRPGHPRRVAEPGAPTGAGPAGADPDPPLPEGGSADSGGACGAYGGGDPASQGEVF